MAFTTAQIINIARISLYLAANDVAKGALFGIRKIPTSPRIIYMELKALEWLYALDPTNSSLTQVGNYVYSLCRGYNLAAQGVSGGGGSISPINPNVSLPAPIEFVVTGSSFMIDGQASVLIPQFAGYNVMFNRDNVPQTMVDTGGTWFTWNKNTTLFTVYGAASTDQLFSINAI
jgi:hypothetical protein